MTTTGGSGREGGRSLKQRVKTARKRTVSQNRWLERQLNDPFVARAKREGKKRDPEVEVKTCPECFAIVPRITPVCACGHTFLVKPRQVETVAGELREVALANVRREARREQGRAQSMEELIAIGHARGMKNPRGWAFYVWNARQQRR